MHNGFLNIDDRKMSKSLGNFFTVRQISDEIGYEPIRYFMLSAHYRTPLNFTMDILEQCKTSLERLYTCRDNLAFAIKNADATAGGEQLREAADTARARFCERMDDDLNTADALAVLFDFAREINTLSAESSAGALQHAAEVFDALCEVLGLLYNRREEEIPADVLALVEERGEARKAKNWQRADEIRDALDAKGYLVEDTPTGPKVAHK